MTSTKSPSISTSPTMYLREILSMPLLLTLWAGRCTSRRLSAGLFFKQVSELRYLISLTNSLAFLLRMWRMQRPGSMAALEATALSASLRRQWKEVTRHPLAVYTPTLTGVSGRRAVLMSVAVFRCR